MKKILGIIATLLFGLAIYAIDYIKEHELSWYPNLQKKTELVRADRAFRRIGWYENGQKRYEEETGLYGQRPYVLEWFENGQMSRESAFGVEIGRWYENGQKASELKRDHYIQWYENGQMKSEAHSPSRRFGPALFVVNRWYEDGSINTEACYRLQGEDWMIADASRIRNSPDVTSYIPTREQLCEWEANETENLDVIPYKWAKSADGVPLLGLSKIDADGNLLRVISNNINFADNGWRAFSASSYKRFNTDGDFVRRHGRRKGSSHPARAFEARRTLSDSPEKAPSCSGNPCSGIGWHSAAGAIGWIELDFGQPREIGEIDLIVTQEHEGQTTHEIWFSSEPIHMDLSNATLAHTFSGVTTQGQVLAAVLPAKTSARHVQIRTTVSPSIVAWHSIKIYGR